MSDARKPRGRATLSDFFAIPDEQRFHELIDGEIVEKAAPSGEHAGAQTEVVTRLNGPFGRRPSERGPGGWWILTEAEVALGDQVCRPDVSGWRREKVPERPRGFPIRSVPDWICEIPSSDRRNDLVYKKNLYHRHRVGHYWVIDPEQRTFADYRYHPEGYLDVLVAAGVDRIRAEPFEAVELPLGVIFGDEEE